MQNEKKVKKKFVLAYGDREKVMKRFGISRRTLYNIEHMLTNSEKADEVRKYFKDVLHLKPYCNYD